MSGSITPISTSAVLCTFLDPSTPLLKPPNQNFLPPSSSTGMWRIFTRQAISRTSNKGYSSTSLYLSRPFNFLGFSQKSTLPEIYKFRPIELNSSKKLKLSELGLCRSSELLVKEDCLAGSGWTLIGNLVNGLSPKGFVSLAEPEVVLSTDVEEEVGLVHEIYELLLKMRKEEEEKKKRMAMKMNGLSKEEKFPGICEREFFALKRRQVKIETETWEQAAKEYSDLLMEMCEHKLAPNLPYIKTMFLGWFEPLKTKIDEVQELIRKRKCKASYAPYFDQLPSDKMAVITMHKLVGLLLTGGEYGYARVVQAACVIGDAIEHEAKLHKFLQNAKMAKVSKGSGGGAEEQRIEEQQRLGKKVINLIKKQKLLAARKIVNAHDDFPSWGADARVKVGGHLINLLLQTAYIQLPSDQIGDGSPDVRPAFVHTFRTVTYENRRGSRRFGVIQCDSMILKGLEKTARHVVIPYMPMLVPPVKWTGYDKGAHFFLPSYLMRTHGSRQQREALKMVPKEQLEPVFQALDTLGCTRWRVNKSVLSIVEKIWASGGRLGGLVDKEDIPISEKPSTEDESEIRKWKWKVRSVKKENSERHSQRCDIELKLAVARKLQDEDGFYYPHNLDFRGRAYPMHPYLNHLGSDLCRGILEFAEGRPLGDSGLRWLKIHLANLYANGVDKLSYEDRISFTENHLDDIFDSADEPLQGRRWWLNAEDPYQCLAVCIDLARALRSPSPQQFVSHIPVHQDGSCNGLQHYAALGRDELGAAAVNLVAGEKPADVYSGIAARVLEIMRRDAEKDPAVSQDAVLARQLMNQVDRKLVKQTVMTSVYGVTYIGARDQIKRRLKERTLFTDETELYRASCYAAKITLTALGEMFQAARSIMTWLGDCAKIIASENQPVRWTTPLGLPVVQPYRKIGRHLVKTSLQVLTLQMETDKVMIKRQKTAFPPNFVHSLDGSHMMMTALACREAGLNFAGVHDSYWTHACDVDSMNQMLRDKFVQLYEQPILEQLLESFQESFPELSFPPLPERGEFELTQVLHSPYFFN